MDYCSLCNKDGFGHTSKVTLDEWTDPKLVWNPSEYGGIKKLHIPADQLWTPDIVLYDNAAGDPHVTIYTDALVYFDGTVVWKPPAIYKSFCGIDIKYFPFDEQKCDMKFGGWSNDGAVMDMRQIAEAGAIKKMEDLDPVGKTETVWFHMEGMDLSYYYKNAAWDLMNVTSRRHERTYPGCCGPDYFVDITFYLHLRRKPLFFAVNILIPCMLIAFLTTFVFYLPPQGHKMTFAISIMVTLTVFFLVLVELIPPVSMNIPLIGSYLLFTMMLVSISILVSVINLNIHHRSGSTHRMNPWVRWLFLKRLPKYLWIKPLRSEGRDPYDLSSRLSPTSQSESFFVGNTTVRSIRRPPLPMVLEDSSKLAHYRQTSPGFGMEPLEFINQSNQEVYHPYIITRMINSVNFIANHFRRIEEQNRENDEWSHVAMVIDRIFLIVFTLVNSIGSLAIILNAPSLWDNSQPLSQPTAQQPLGGDTLAWRFTNHSG